MGPATYPKQILSRQINVSREQQITYVNTMWFSWEFISCSPWHPYKLHCHWSIKPLGHAFVFLVSYIYVFVFIHSVCNISLDLGFSMSRHLSRHSGKLSVVARCWHDPGRNGNVSARLNKLWLSFKLWEVLLGNVKLQCMHSLPIPWVDDFKQHVISVEILEPLYVVF